MDVLLFETKTHLATISNKYKRKNLGSLLDQFPNRKRKQEAIQHLKERQSKDMVTLYPPGTSQNAFDFVFHLI